MLRVPRKSFVFRDGRRWVDQCHFAGLANDKDGAQALTLWRVPTVAQNTSERSPSPTSFKADLIPFATSPNGWLAFASNDSLQITLIDTLCADARWLWDARDCGIAAEGRITALALSHQRLAIAESGTRSLRLLTLPGLTEVVRIAGELEAVALGFDAAESLRALDTSAGRLRRFDRSGALDTTYDVLDARLATAQAMAVAPDGTAFVALADASELLMVSPDGNSCSVVPPPNGAADFSPGALAIASDGKRLFVADRKSGRIWLRDVSAAIWLAPVSNFVGSVAGMGMENCGRLFVKGPEGDDIQRLEPAAAFIGRGELTAGPLDAGSLCGWLRLRVEADVPAETRVRVWTSVTESPFSRGDWQPAASLDSLVAAPRASDAVPDDERRFLWIRLELSSDDPARSPRLLQITAETEAESYLEQLPAVYAREDAATGFLRRWLETVRAEFGDLEARLDDLPRTLAPMTAPEALLPWLASWIAYDIPRDADEAAVRAALQSAYHFYETRGTPRGLREAVRLQTGIECELSESFRARHFWRLGEEGLGLGFDSGLLPRLPDGMVVPGPSLAALERQGLEGTYLRDPDRGRFLPIVRVDARLDLGLVLADFGATRELHVRWTGQIRPRFSELHTFFLRHAGAATLLIGGDPVIASFPGDKETEARGQLPLEEGRWYPVEIELRVGATPSPARLELSWQSRRQPKSVVPTECFYADPDDNVIPETRLPEGRADALVVGDTVVGAHGPLAAEDFGAPLFDDEGHHFVVRVRACDVADQRRLQRLREVLDAEKPAFTTYELCVVAPTLLVGQQARVGIDAFVAADPRPAHYGEGILGLDTRLGISPAHDDGSLRVEENLRLGPAAVLR